ncbi:MAG: hypothetical protein JOZ47_22435 [Kutzneria sp.]|nr:hypothetical protein [Kutzneria sp.]MBV9847806.1 hypothetical protein [Kutzneria sp.]
MMFHGRRELTDLRQRHAERLTALDPHDVAIRNATRADLGARLDREAAVAP